MPNSVHTDQMQSAGEERRVTQRMAWYGMVPKQNTIQIDNRENCAKH